MKVILVSICFLDIEQYVEFKMSVLISPSKSLISLRWVTYLFKIVGLSQPSSFARNRQSDTKMNKPAIQDLCLLSRRSWNLQPIMNRCVLYLSPFQSRSKCTQR